MVTLPWVHVLHYNITSTMLRVHTDVFMKVYWYSINSVTTMVVTARQQDATQRRPNCAGTIPKGAPNAGRTNTSETIRTVHSPPPRCQNRGTERSQGKTNPKLSSHQPPLKKIREKKVRKPTNGNRSTERRQWSCI